MDQPTKLYRLSQEVSQYSKSVEFALSGFEIPPAQFAPFLKSCLELFRSETLRDFGNQAHSIAELAEKYAREHGEKIRPGTNLVDAHAGLTLGTKVIPLYEKKFPLDNLNDNLENYVHEITNGLNSQRLARAQQTPDLGTQLSASVSARSAPHLELYSIELFALPYAADLPAHPSIKIGAKTMNGIQRFIDHLIELSGELARQTYGSLGYPVIETRVGSVPLPPR